MGTSVGALLMIVGATEPAHAVSYPFYTDCETPGVLGNGWFSDWTPKHVDMILKVNDDAADGHHVAIRFVSQDNAYNLKYWKWHHLYDGKGTTKSWTLSADDSTGHMNGVGIQVAVMEGDEQIANCTNMV
ncbi:hypothetical protein [Streptomyces fuscichromogenes]|uniref:Uncharacterized protein n=1 Tax=Streptomyces fuscichromogenes TaxID=1324013 RepID=A0A917XLJ2_9ACTN|nr:hypothetical protein [Streptomyces fuscichromogenes]GGN37258.1 hypothetical protein GCM10011578_081340 [Streptomyces fuscichromogenes]